MSFVASSLLSKTDFLGREQNETMRTKKTHFQVYYESLTGSICSLEENNINTEGNHEKPEHKSTQKQK